MVILDTTVVNIALPAISQDLGAFTSALEWVIEGYSVVVAVCLLSADALGDRRGAKKVFLWALALFSASSLACGLAPATAFELALTGAMDGLVVNIADEAPLSIYEIAQIVGSLYESSSEPLANPWKGHMDVSLARSLGFQPMVPTVHHAIREGRL